MCLYFSAYYKGCDDMRELRNFFSDNLMNLLFK